MKSTYIGLISGTSVDGIDAIAIQFGPENQPKQIASLSYPIEDSLREQIFSVQSRPVHLEEFGQLDTRLGMAFANAALELIEVNNLDRNDIAAIGSHGQTVKHDPGGTYPYTIQLGNPSVISENTSITTVADFRRRDIAAGGQGAPLVLAFHQAWLSQSKNTAVLNMGGIANITVLAENQAEPILGFDTGPANTLLDSFIEKHLNQPFDEQGQWAKEGTSHTALLKSLLKHPYFRKQPPKSADISQFNLKWLDNFIKMFPDISDQDVMTTLVDLTITSITDALNHWSPDVTHVVACGGGCKNTFLMEELSKRLSPVSLNTSDDFGLGVDWVEAAAFAWLAKQTLDKKPGNSPGSTGASHPCVLGGIYYA
ncbi:MAG: anhydro-N-acetylmuramic acid kinase [Pseudomonadota bacterium]